MTTRNATTVTLKIPTYERVLRRKKYPEESIDKTINRILDGEINEQPR